jgi:gamma-glutamyltranspeptidase / glutathione hydrolase
MRDFQQPGRSPVFAANGICATSHPLAAATAVRLMQDGGNAVDAAIGAAVLLGLCEPQMTGIGGDCFVLVKPPGEDRVIALNGSGRAPAALSAAEMRGRGLSTVPVDGPEAVTVPGAVDAFCRLSQDWGRLGLGEVLAPAIRYAEEGVPVAPRVAFDWAIAADTLRGAARRHYLLADKAPHLGQVFRAPGQAEVLRRIAAGGRAAFYEGEVAEDMVAALRAAGGVHTLDDFAATAADYGDPVAGTYKGVELLEHPPNGQGATAILMANILAHFDLPSMDPLGAERAHVEAEAAKLAYDARNRFLADPDHMTRLAHMLAPETAAKLAALIRMDEAMAAAAPLTEAVHRDTIYLTVVDRDRMAVSLIYSVYHSFGSGIATDRFGILFQNRGAGFTLTEGHPERGRGRQAADAHDHSRDAARERARHHALRRDGRRLPAQRPCPRAEQHGRLRDGPAGRARRAALLLGRRHDAGGEGLSGGRAGEARRTRPRGGDARDGDRRRTGDPHPSRGGRSGGCLGPAEGRLRAGLLVQREVQRVVPVLEIPEEVGEVGMRHRLARIVRQKVLFGHIGHVVALVVLGQQVVERLVLRGPAVLGNGVIPFLGVGEPRVHVEDHAAKRMFAVPHDLAEMILGTSFQHKSSPMVLLISNQTSVCPSSRRENAGNRL